VRVEIKAIIINRIQNLEPKVEELVKGLASRGFIWETAKVDIKISNNKD
jgi:hypothetical protein